MFAPGIASISSFIKLAKSSQLSADVHSDLSFKTIIKSPLSIGIGSVGISPLPILVTIVLISGNFAFNIFLCALVYYTNGQGLNNCTEVSGAVGDKGTVNLNFPLNNNLDLDTVRIGIFQEGSAPLSGVLLDDVSVVCNEVFNSS